MKLRPNRTFDYQLASDRGSPDADTFQLCVLSGETNDELSELTSSYSKTTDKDQRRTIFAKAIEIAVVAWPWNGTLRSVLTDRECWELIAGATLGAALTPEERKKFVLPPSSGTDSSVEGAAATAN